jgi:outer membrane protein OmpA-like peptidoglycan-associated protein
MRCNWWRWLWGIIPLLVLSWVAVQAEQGRIEGDLRVRATQALVEGGMGWAAVRLEGRDAILQGLSGDEAEPDKVTGLLSGVWGLRVVENRIDLAPETEKYVWTAGRRGNRIRITGHVPNRATRRIILSVAKANFPTFEVVDRMETTRGVPSPDTWLGGVGFALKQLAALKRGDVRLEGLGMWISGEAEDLDSYRAVKSALANSLPKGIKLTDDLVTPPVVSPFTWSAQLADGRLVLSGHVPGEAVRAELLAAAKASVKGSVVDQMRPGGGAPQDWNAAAAASVRGLARLLSGSAEIRDTGLTVSGLAADAGAADAARAALRAGLPASIKLTDHIKAKEPPPPPPPAPPAPAPSAAPPPAKEGDASPAVPQATSALPSPPALAPAPAPTPQVKTEPAPPPSTPAPQPAPAPMPESKPAPPAVPPPPAEATVRSPAQVEADLKAKACEEELQGLVRSGQIAFRYASAVLDAASKPTLDRLAEAAKTCPGLQIEVAGHASSEGTPMHNRQLSLKRANSVVAYLVRAGVDAAQLQPVGYGASRPAAPNDTAESKARNRRIEFTVRAKPREAN